MKQYQDKDWLFNKYQAEQLSLTEVGTLCGVSYNCIWEWLKIHKIERRKTGPASGGLAWNSGETSYTDKRILTGKNHGMWGRKHSEKSRKISGEKIKDWYMKHPSCHRMEDNPFYGKKHSNETIRKIKNKLSLEGSPSWRGGISFEPYGIEFNNELKGQIRKRDNHACQLCGIKQNGRAHDVHHVDYNKKNNRQENLVSLCHKCHMKTNHNRNNWINEFKDKDNG